jgi:methyl-CpG-binding domain protein 4|tara:strand:+ start:135 stop:554 length:420 start_codon:yes stop_codon:yes gene_type:complete
MSWIPPKSSHDLLQEHYWDDQWKVLVCCLMLNQTSRKQVDQIIGEFFIRYPDPESLLEGDEESMRELLRSLGMYNRRVKTLKRFSEDFLARDWNTASDLYGCGKYADDAWRIFCRGDWQNVKPDDHALTDYHNWLMGNE